MTKMEEKLLNARFDGLSKLFEEKLKSSETIICNKISGIEKRVYDTKRSVDDHISWHNNINRRIVSCVIKYSLITVGVTIIVVLVLGVKDGIIPGILVKMAGL